MSNLTLKQQQQQQYILLLLLLLLQKNARIGQGAEVRTYVRSDVLGVRTDTAAAAAAAAAAVLEPPSRTHSSSPRWFTRTHQPVPLDCHLISRPRRQAANEGG